MTQKNKTQKTNFFNNVSTRTGKIIQQIKKVSRYILQLVLQIELAPIAIFLASFVHPDYTITERILFSIGLYFVYGAFKRDALAVVSKVSKE